MPEEMAQSVNALVRLARLAADVEASATVANIFVGVFDGCCVFCLVRMRSRDSEAEVAGAGVVGCKPLICCINGLLLALNASTSITCIGDKSIGSSSSSCCCTRDIIVKSARSRARSNKSNRRATDAERRRRGQGALLTVRLLILVGRGAAPHFSEVEEPLKRPVCL